MQRTTRSSHRLPCCIFLHSMKTVHPSFDDPSRLPSPQRRAPHPPQRTTDSMQKFGPLAGARRRVDPTSDRHTHTLDPWRIEQPNASSRLPVRNYLGLKIMKGSSLARAQLGAPFTTT